MPVTPDQDGSHEAARARLAKYEAICETLVALMVVSAHWANSEQRSRFTGVLQRLGDRWREPREGGALIVYQALLDYPATLALYGAGLGAVAGDRLDTLAHLLGDVRVVRLGRREPLLHEITPSRVVDGRILQTRPGYRIHTPVSDHLAEVLREPLRQLVPNDGAFIDVFDRFEYLLSIAFADLAADEIVSETAAAPAGSFAWRHRHDRSEGGLRQRIEAEAREAGPAWPLLQGPLFDGRLDRFLEVKQAVDLYIARLPIH